MENDNHYLTIMKSVYDYLQTHTASMGMIHQAKGFPQKEVKNFVRELERKGLVSKVEKRRCKRVGSIAWYYTSKKKLFPEPGKAPKSNTIIGACLNSKKWRTN